MKQLLLFILFFATALAAPLMTNADSVTAQNNAALNLIHTLGCKGCHTIGKDGGSLAPDLTQVGSRLTEAQIIARLKDHQQPREEGFMPNYSSLDQRELKLISNYLYNLR